MLAISHLSKTYPNGVKALNDVTLNIDRGLFGLLGPNGAGKSTLMRTIATLQEADSGAITFDGFNISADPRLLRGKLGYLPQTFGVYPRIPAIELLDYLAILNGRVWRKTVPKHAIPEYRSTHTVISTHLFGGETRVHMLADAPPESGCELVAPDLEDVYFSVLCGTQITQASAC